MALANFFDKAALAASQIIQGFDRSSFEQQLEKTIILLGFDSSALSREGLLTLDMATRLLGRLYPKMVIKALDSEAQAHVHTIKEQLTAINPEIELLEEVGDVSNALIVGTTVFTAPQMSGTSFYVGSRGWLAEFSPHGPVGSGNSQNPFGAGAAACLGAANIFRAVFADMLPDAEIDGPISLSLVDYSVNAQEQAELPDFPEEVCIEETILVGLGAIGNGMIWALGKLPQAKGMLHLVEHDPIDLSNLQRYVLTSQDDVDGSKIDLAVKHLKGTGIKPIAHPGKWSTFLRSRQNWELPRIAVAVDSAEDRIAIQAAVPSKIINAWTQTFDLGVSRHVNFMEDACLACLYLPKHESKSESTMIAEALELPEPEVREMLYRNSLVDMNLAIKIAAIKQHPVEDLIPFVGKPLRIFYQKAICGGVIMTSSEGQRNETPMAFQSALAGIMLAAELVQQDLGIRKGKFASTTRINLLTSIGKYLNMPVKKQTDGRCICGDRHYQNAFLSKYTIEQPRYK